MIARRGSYKPGTKQNGSLPLSGRGQRFCLCTPEQALMTPQDREVPVPVAYWIMVLILDVKTVSFVAAPLQSDRCPVTKGQKDMIEVVRGKANCENLRTHRKAIGLGGGRAGLIIVIVASFPLSIVSSVAAKPRSQLAASSTSLNFGSVLEGSSASQYGTLSNSGRGTVTIEQASVYRAAFSISGLSLPLTLSPGASAGFTVLFTPNAADSITGSVTFFSDAVNSPTTIALSGAGVAPSPQISLSPAAFNFGNIGVGSSASQMVTASNAGTATLTISQAAVTGTGFNLSRLTLPVSLPAGTSIAFTVTFAPQAAGTTSGSVTLTSDAPNSPTSVALSGTGVQPQLSITPGSVSFGNVVDGTTNTQTIQLTNSGNAHLTVSQAAVSGSGLTVSGLALPLALSPGQSANFNLAFSPASATSITGSVSLASNAPSSPMAIPLSGTGVAATFLLGANPTSLSYGNVNVAGNSSLTATLTNTGNSNVTVSSVTATGTGFSSSGVSAGTTLAPNQSVTLNVAFAPAVAGSVTGSVSVASNATNSPTVLSLSGAAVQPQVPVVPTCVTVGKVVVGTTNTQTIQLTNSGTATLTVSQAAVSGSGFTITGLALPLTLTPGQSGNFNLAFSPASAAGVTASVSLASDAPASPTTIAVSATGVAATLQLPASATSLAFG